MKTKEEIIEFSKVADYGFLFGAGLMAANDEETRNFISEKIEDADSYELLSEVGEEASELQPEFENGCEIYRFIKTNAWQLYIAVY